ncbi:hypothetical protein CDL15_Pgr020919 [Punica granatum]|uniref:Uncharacterized protein n=1 Tax=Punica granatum TaxID=22663 RepID=A0A218XUX5_PUNGR|nr:hypothetical protein CDL15_Pgr020919 [Punica granatum]
MERAPEMERLKFLGVHGMFGESLWVISARKKLFAQITLVLIFSLICIFFFANAELRCKSYHQENLDVSYLADRLEVYHKSIKDVQFEQSQV